jgi:hypothetical protein
MLPLVDDDGVGWKIVKLRLLLGQRMKLEWNGIEKMDIIK